MSKKTVEVLIEFGIVLVVGTVLAKLAMRYVDSPDGIKTVQMKVWRGVKSVANGQAEWWSQVGARAATRYNKARL